MNNASDFVINNGVLEKYTGKGGDVIIPEGVTSIGNGAFASCFALTSVVIPEGVTSIGERAFHSCIKLTKASIPNSVSLIGFGAFTDCVELSRYSKCTRHRR